MKKPTLSLAAALALVAGCAGVGGQIFQTLLGQHLTLGFPKAIGMPHEMTVNLSKPGGTGSQAEELGKSVFSAVMGSSLEQKVGQAVKKAGLPVREITANAFRQELKKANLFGAISEDKGDLALDLGIARWGLEYSEAAGKVLPVLDLEASLSFGAFGRVWTGRRSAADLSAAVKDKAHDLSLSLLASRPKDLSRVYELMAADLSRQLVEEMRSRPPRVRQAAEAP